MKLPKLPEDTSGDSSDIFNCQPYTTSPNEEFTTSPKEDDLESEIWSNLDMSLLEDSPEPVLSLAWSIDDDFDFSARIPSMDDTEDIFFDTIYSEIPSSEIIPDILSQDLQFSAFPVEEISSEFVGRDQPHLEGQDQFVAPSDLQIDNSDNESVFSDQTESEELSVHFILHALKESGYLPWDIMAEDFSKFLEDFEIADALIYGVDCLLESIEWLDIGGLNTVIALCRWRLDNRIILNKLRQVKAILDNNRIFHTVQKSHFSPRAIFDWLRQLGFAQKLRESEGTFGIYLVAAGVIETGLGGDALHQRLIECQKNERIRKGNVFQMGHQQQNADSHDIDLWLSVKLFRNGGIPAKENVAFKKLVEVKLQQYYSL
ncbi:hypothetical protein EDC01DRAFT_751376 [Geopyxis carbonaria]|nr:hypothetical protein EDC01DRAFT_751376 [Geopyxis carbonaria]